MIGDVTQVQGEDDRLRARDLSLQRQQPPTQVPGYEPERFLGAGAYGEVWVALDRNTGRRVAIKFYAHRGGLDWSLLSREVDKLALLFSDRYVVQLIEVGWDADPPYYVMEYLERGSLEERLRQGPMPVPEAVALFREVAVALVHAHGKGILHCDLKPANVLLDQDWKPRLADFGQSRLSHEQTPALGTLFYMAPEQADLTAAPDARWDVYALGALLYCMLTGQPPYRDAKLAQQINQPTALDQRLARYRQAIKDSPRPSAHRRVPGVDRALAEITDRCLAVDPHHRFPNAQAVLDALEARDLRRSRQPLLVLGAIGPGLLLSIVSLLAWDGFHAAVRESTRSLVASAQVGDVFIARVYADHIATSIDRRWRILENVAEDPEFRDLVQAAGGAPVGSTPRDALQAQVETLREQHVEIPSFSWMVLGPTGRLLARSPLDERLIDADLSGRDLFHGRGHRLAPGTHVTPIARAHRSVIYRSLAPGQPRLVAFSVPVWSGEPDEPGRRVVGVLITTVEVGVFADFGINFADFGVKREASRDLLAVLVDTEPDDHGVRGAVLLHPHLAEIRERDPMRPLPDCHVDPTRIKVWDIDYRDPIGRFDPSYDVRWLAAREKVQIEGRGVSDHDTGWVVLVQERYESVIGPVLALRHTLVVRGEITVALVVLILGALWAGVIGALNGSARTGLAMLWRRGFAATLGSGSGWVSGSNSITTGHLPPVESGPPAPPAPPTPPNAPAS